MKIRTQLSLLSAAGLLVASASAMPQEELQQGTPTRAPQQKAAMQEDEARPLFVREADLRGLVLTAGEGPAAEEIAKIEDLILDPKDGRVVQVIVTSKGAEGAVRRALPARSIELTRGEKGALSGSLGVSAERFASVPALTREALEKLLKRDAREAVAERAGGTPIPASARKHRLPHQMAEALAGLDVYGPDATEGSGEVADLVIDWDRGAAAFLTVQHDEKALLLPLGAVKIEAMNAEEAKTPEDLVLGVRLPRDLDALADGPHLDAESGFDLSRPAFVERVYAYYDVVDPRG